MKVSTKQLDPKFKLRLGNDLVYGGMVLTNGEETLIVPLPDSYPEILSNDIQVIDNPEAFEEIIKQTDLLEVEIFEAGKNTKIIVRKSQRQLDDSVKWEVFRRDNFTCRYCNNNKVPMSYDHLKLWEDEGPTTVENGLTACKKCNRTRGSIQYEDWLKTPYYKKVSKNLPPAIQIANEALVSVVKNIAPRVSKRNR